MHLHRHSGHWVTQACTWKLRLHIRCSFAAALLFKTIHCMISMEMGPDFQLFPRSRTHPPPTSLLCRERSRSCCIILCTRLLRRTKHRMHSNFPVRMRAHWFPNLRRHEQARLHEANKSHPSPTKFRVERTNIRNNFQSDCQEASSSRSHAAGAGMRSLCSLEEKWRGQESGTMWKVIPRNVNIITMCNCNA